MSDALFLFGKCLPTVRSKNEFRKKNILYANAKYVIENNTYATILQLVNIFIIILFIYTLVNGFYTVEWPCYNMNSCAHWMLGWLRITVALFVLILSTTYRRNATVTCLIESEMKVDTPYNGKSRLITRLYFVTLTAFFIMKIMILRYKSDNLHSTFIFLLYDFSYIIPLPMECIVISLCKIIENACYQINQTLEKITSCNSSNSRIVFANNIKELIKMHENAACLLRKTGKCFEKDLLVDLAFNMVWIIVYTYIIITSIISLWKTGSVWLDYVVELGLIVDMFVLIIRICFLAHAASRIENRIRNMLIKLRDFNCGRNMDEISINLINDFQAQVMDIDMRIQVCGFFHLNLSFMRAVIKLATTYVIVFIQYGVNEQTNMPKSTNNENISSFQ